jgi:hypothetical protein
MKYSLSYNFNSFLIGLKANVIKHTPLLIRITYLLLLSCPENLLAVSIKHTREFRLWIVPFSFKFSYHMMKSN